MFYITGDTHYNIDNLKVKTWFEANKAKLTMKDYLIIAGDFLTPCFGKMPETDRLLDYYSEMNCMILFVDGNHENFAELNALPVETWNGGKVHKLRDNVIHLMRGQVYNIDDITIFTLGGAVSPDRAMRVEGVTWFKEEDISDEEYQEAKTNLEKVNNKVDLVITHTVSNNFLKCRLFSAAEYNESFAGNINKALDEIELRLECKDWYFGHFHIDKDFKDSNKHAMFNRIIKIDAKDLKQSSYN